MHEDTASDAIADIAIEKRKKKMTKKRQKGKLAEEMSKITAKVKKTDKEQDQERRIKKTAQVKKAAKKDAKAIIEKLPAIIRRTAKTGGSNIYEWCPSDSEYGSFKLGFIAEWARKQGFNTKITHNNDAANEGGFETDDLKISWE